MLGMSVCLYFSCGGGGLWIVMIRRAHRLTDNARFLFWCRLLFNPVVQWWRRGPIAPQIHRFLWSSAPLHYKISMMSYMFSYCACLPPPSPSTKLTNYLTDAHNIALGSSAALPSYTMEYSHTHAIPYGAAPPHTPTYHAYAYA